MVENPDIFFDESIKKWHSLKTPAKMNLRPTFDKEPELICFARGQMRYRFVDNNVKMLTNRAGGGV